MSGADGHVNTGEMEQIHEQGANSGEGTRRGGTAGPGLRRPGLVSASDCWTPPPGAAGRARKVSRSAAP